MGIKIAEEIKQKTRGIERLATESSKGFSAIPSLFLTLGALKSWRVIPTGAYNFYLTGEKPKFY